MTGDGSCAGKPVLNKPFAGQFRVAQISMRQMRAADVYLAALANSRRLPRLIHHQELDVFHAPPQPYEVFDKRRIAVVCQRTRYLQNTQPPLRLRGPEKSDACRLGLPLINIRDIAPRERLAPAPL